MRHRRETRLLAALVLFALALVQPERAAAQSFLVNLDGLVAFPAGSPTSVRGTSTDLAVGVGVHAEVLYRIAPGFSAGLAAGLASHRSDVVVATTTARGNLTVVPVHVITEVHYQGTDSDYGLFATAGAGFTDYNLQPDKIAASGTMSQTEFSFVLSGGASYDITESWGLRLGLQYHQTVSTDGPLWVDGQNPKAFYLTLGARFRQGGSGEN